MAHRRTVRPGSQYTLGTACSTCGNNRPFGSSPNTRRATPSPRYWGIDSRFGSVGTPTRSATRIRHRGRPSPSCTCRGRPSDALRNPHQRTDCYLQASLEDGTFHRERRSDPDGTLPPKRSSSSHCGRWCGSSRPQSGEPRRPGRRVHSLPRGAAWKLYLPKLANSLRRSEPRAESREPIFMIIVPPWRTIHDPYVALLSGALAPRTLEPETTAAERSPEAPRACVHAVSSRTWRTSRSSTARLETICPRPPGWRLPFKRLSAWRQN